jgi:hypothetical protein
MMSRLDRHSCAAYGPFDASRHQTGGMTSAEQQEYEQHLQDCGTCRTALRQQQRLDRLVAELPAYRAPEVLEVQPSSAARWWPVATALAAAAALIVWLLFPAGERPPSLWVSEALAADHAAIEEVFTTVQGAPAPPNRDRNPVAPIPWLGFVTCADHITPPVDGVYLCALQPEGPLGRSGIQAGAILLSVEQERVRSATEMYRVLSRYRVGDAVSVVLRTENGDTRVQVYLEARRLGPRHPFGMQWSPALRASLDRQRPDHLDVNEVFVPVPDSLSTRLGVRDGLWVMQEPTREQTGRTLLAALPYLFGPEGLQSGDVIVAVENHPVTDRRSFWFALMEVQKNTFTLLVHRGVVPVRLHFQPEQ